jgi:hypothetical protein
MTRKLFRYLLFSIPVIILIIYIFNERRPFGGSNSSFSVKPGAEINRIEFSDKSGSLTLEKEGEDWRINKKYETRESSIQFILKILTEIQIKSPVTPELFRSEIVSRNIAPVKVRVFGRQRLLKSFLVYKTRSNAYGNIMKLREGSKPFIVYVPGSDTEIGSAFTVNKLFWQPYSVFNILPSEIRSVSLENLADTASSFTIEKKKAGISLYGRSLELRGWDSSRVIRYLSYFISIPFESWAFDLPAEEKDRIKKEVPVYRISVIRTGGDEIQLTLWKRQVEENGIRKEDTDRLWGKTGAMNEIFIIRYMDIDPLLKKRSYFFPE